MALERGDIMNNYEINSKTLAIIPMKNNISKVIEENNIFYINKNPISIIDHSCKYFGSSYEGRHIGTVNMIGKSYKTPILIEETHNIIFFPTLSSKSKECYWISLNNIEKYKVDNINSTVIFKNGYKLNLNISYGSLENQILRSTLLDSIVRKHQKIS